MLDRNLAGISQSLDIRTDDDAPGCVVIARLRPRFESGSRRGSNFRRSTESVVNRYGRHVVVDIRRGGHEPSIEIINGGRGPSHASLETGNCLRRIEPGETVHRSVGDLRFDAICIRRQRRVSVLMVNGERRYRITCSQRIGVKLIRSVLARIPNSRLRQIAFLIRIVVLEFAPRNWRAISILDLRRFDNVMQLR